MSMRGVKKDGASTVTTEFTGVFRTIARSSAAFSICLRAAAMRRFGAQTTDDVENGADFAPRFSADGLIACVTVDARDGAVLMVAHMNAEALAKDAGDGGRALLVAFARRALAQGRHLGPDPAAGRAQGRLRPGRPAGAWSRSAATAAPATPARRSCFYRRVRLVDGRARLESRERQSIERARRARQMEKVACLTFVDGRCGN